MRTEGISLELIDKEARREQAQFSGDNDTARFTIEFTVEAFGEDVYIPFGATTTAAATTTGVVFDILGSNSTIVTSGFANGILDSSADERDGAFVVREGDSETFTLEVSYNPEITGFYQLELQQVFFRGEGEADSEAQAHLAKPDATFRTSSVNVRG